MNEKLTQSNPNEGRTIVHRGYGREIVLSTSYEKDDFRKMFEVLKNILDIEIDYKGGNVNYVE